MRFVDFAFNMLKKFLKVDISCEGEIKQGIPLFKAQKFYTMWHFYMDFVNARVNIFIQKLIQSYRFMI